MNVYGDGRIRCIKRYSDSKENYEKRERGGTCLILDIMGLVFYQLTTIGSLYNYVQRLELLPVLSVFAY